jgi:hypothetical protein
VFGLVIGLIELSHLVITSKDYVLSVLYTSQITIAHTRSSQSVTVLISRCLVAASNEDVYLVWVRELSPPSANTDRAEKSNSHCCLAIFHTHVTRYLEVSGDATAEFVMSTDILDLNPQH